jgi:DNA-nicking Smr family endonuclease
MPKWNFLSGVARLFGFAIEQEKTPPPEPSSYNEREIDEKPPPKEPLPTPTAIKKTGEEQHVVKETSPQIPGLRKQARSGEPDTKKKKKRTGKKKDPEPKVDTKGFRIITDQHDLHKLFSGESMKKKEKEDFVRLFEESQTDSIQLRLLEDKKQSQPEQRKTQRTPTEQVKSFPPPQAELDLHGYTSAEAETAAEMFIQNARQKGTRTIRLIVGKGLHSEGKAVLPEVVERKIIALKRNKSVLTYAWEKKDKRKSGALIVYLMPAGG